MLRDTSRETVSKVSRGKDASSSGASSSSEAAPARKPLLRSTGDTSNRDRTATGTSASSTLGSRAGPSSRPSSIKPTVTRAPGMKP
eukprot:2804746-Pyramimonas_sp.AAC.1